MRYVRPTIIGLLAVAALSAAIAALHPSPGESAFPGVNGKIAFQSGSLRPNFNVYVMNPDGSARTALAARSQRQRRPNHPAAPPSP